ncbi:MAG: hypothetical protein IT449_05330 [Phycisphaerales bacterium]|nr:hypothetical protein [Phycisphaerales bacterium]
MFTALATRAGEGISAIPLTDFAPVPAETFRTANPALRWIFLLFDGAWTQRWPALRAQRDCIHHQQIFPYDLQQLRKLKRHRVLGPQLSFPDRWLERLPHSFTSELDDLFSASSAAIDILTEQAGNPPNAESPVSGSSERHTAARPMDKEPEDGAPYLASRAFPKSLRSDTLAKAAEAGRVRRIRHGKHWRYSWPDAHKEWSHIVPVDPPKPKP